MFFLLAVRISDFNNLRIKFAFVHKNVYNELNPILKKTFMKKNILEKELRELGWYLLRQGSNHEIWTNGEITEPIPRHREISEILAKKILKKAIQNRAKKGN